MSARSLWMRLLLSFAMILNGSVAVAGVMPGMAAAGEASPAQASMAGAGHCDDVDMQEHLADSSNGSPQHASAFQYSSDSNDYTTPDCCESGMCQCACVHATATLELLQPPLLTISTPAVVAFVDRGVTPTRPSRLDRPPIA